jgi:hypothetical protein
LPVLPRPTPKALAAALRVLATTAAVPPPAVVDAVVAVVAALDVADVL